uniref:Uncharacterized protein n=1 Tax=Anguilla anguilla TaxID=7936 RepID=A0A0E9UHK0_ANGAN
MKCANLIIYCHVLRPWLWILQVFLNHVQIFHTCIMAFPSITAGLQG